MTTAHRASRRDFLTSVAVGLSCAASGLPALAAPAAQRPKRLAVVTTEWRSHSHAWHMAERFLNGYPVKARGMGGRQVRTGKEFGEIYDHHAVEFFYENGTTNFSQCRHIRGCWSNVSEHAVGSKGICDVSGYSIKPKGGEGWRYKGKDKDPYQVEHDDLFAAIRNNQPYNEAFNGAKSTMTAILGRLATYSGVEVSWEDALNSNVDLHPDSYSWDTTPKTLAGPDGFYPVSIPGKTKVV